MNPKLLEKTKTYLCGPMQYKNGETWRNIVERKLDTMGITVFNPYKKPFIKDLEEGDYIRERLLSLMECGEYDKVEKIMREIRYYDLNLVDRSDFIIAYIDPTVPTFGAMEELSLAVSEKKPIFLIIDGNISRCPLWVMGMISHKYMYSSIDDMLDMIVKIDNGEKVIDSNRWRLLRKQFR